MDPITPVTIKTPDGVERSLRFTFGARKRIVDLLGCGPREALTKYDSGALPDLLYACMFGQDGDPPVNKDGSPFDVKAYRESADQDASTEMMAAFLGAMTKGAVPKNELEALVRKSQEDEVRKMFGLTSGALLDSASGSPPESSGISPSESSTPSPSGTESKSEGSTTAQV